jgi:hypothetical protein
MLYPKVMSPFKRHTEGLLRSKLDMGNWAREEFWLLKDLPWVWTEKVDGINVRVIWDGYKVRFGGRTEDAQMPTALLDVLADLFTEELLEQQFGRNPAILFGEGYGAKIQKGGGDYRPDQGFVLFDVKVGDWWLLLPALMDVADGLGIDTVPVVGFITIEQAIQIVSAGHKSNWGDFPAEGLVGRPPIGLTARDGDRLLLKVKTKDFP